VTPMIDPTPPPGPGPAGPPSRLEPEYDAPWRAYSADPSPANADAVLKAAEPILRLGVSTYGGGGDSPILRGHARRIFVEALPGYDPSRASLKTHAMSHLRGLQRHAARRDRILDVPEQLLLDRRRLEASRVELADELGRDPSDEELSDHSRIPMRRMAAIRSYVPAASRGQLAAAAAAAGRDADWADPAVELPGGGLRRAEMLYPELDPTDQSILERILGLRGRPKASAREVAAALGISPSAVTQRAQKIQARLDELAELGVE